VALSQTDKSQPAKANIYNHRGHRDKT
jgi:hypothetical protein